MEAHTHELRAALEEALREVDADELVGPHLRSTGLRMRFELSDVDLALNLAAAEDGHNIRWSFDDDPGWRPKLVLRMSSEDANRYLQGRESLAISIARGKVRCRGESRVALLYLPATKFISDAYRRVVEAGYPELVAA